MKNVELITEIARRASFRQDDVKLMLTALGDTIRDRLGRGDDVVISGLGTFRTVSREAREGRHPRTGERIQIAATVNATFKPAKALRDQTNQRRAAPQQEQRRRA